MLRWRCWLMWSRSWWLLVGSWIFGFGLKDSTWEDAEHKAASLELFEANAALKEAYSSGLGVAAAELRADTAMAVLERVERRLEDA